MCIRDRSKPAKRPMTHTDSEAARLHVKRPGVGKIRHLDVRVLFLKDLNERGTVEFRRVEGSLNLADVLTKAVDEK
eukprot:5600827-Alexandrium_andersonii.AAC.1